MTARPTHDDERPAPPLKADGSRYRFLDLVRAPNDVLFAAMRGGVAPRFENLAGWELAGVNTNTLSILAGIRKFKKGFFEGGAPRAPGGPEPFIQGYNVVVRQDGIERRHTAKPSEERPKRHGFYRVHAVVPGARDSLYPNALLLDYGLGGNGVDISAPLRDYLVQVYPDDPDLLLGDAYFAVLGMRIHLGFFAAYRMNRHDFHG